MEHLTFIYPKDLFMQTIKYVVENSKAEKDKKLGYLKKIVAEHEFVDNEDLFNIVKGSYIPSAKQFDSLDVKDYKPLNQEALILFYIHNDTDLSKIQKIVNKLTENDFGLLGINNIPEDEMEHLIIIS